MFLELSDAVRTRLIADMQENEILEAVEHLESEDIADLVSSLSKDTVSALFGLRWLGRDPVFGSSVMLTAITDSMGFFIFLGLAAVFLI